MKEEGKANWGGENLASDVLGTALLGRTGGRAVNLYNIDLLLEIKSTFIPAHLAIQY
jgi:hypothetical protein